MPDTRTLLSDHQRGRRPFQSWATECAWAQMWLLFTSTWWVDKTFAKREKNHSLYLLNYCQRRARDLKTPVNLYLLVGSLRSVGISPNLLKSRLQKFSKNLCGQHGLSTRRLYLRRSCYATPLTSESMASLAPIWNWMTATLPTMESLTLTHRSSPMPVECLRCSERPAFKCRSGHTPLSTMTLLISGWLWRTGSLFGNRAESCLLLFAGGMASEEFWTLPIPKHASGILHTSECLNTTTTWPLSSLTRERPVTSHGSLAPWPLWLTPPPSHGATQRWPYPSMSVPSSGWAIKARTSPVSSGSLTEILCGVMNWASSPSSQLSWLLAFWATSLFYLIW